MAFPDISKRPPYNWHVEIMSSAGAIFQFQTLRRNVAGNSCFSRFSLFRAELSRRNN